MNVFIDTNILLDILLVREHHFHDSQDVIKLVEAGMINGYINQISVNNIWYIARKLSKEKLVRSFLADVLDTLTIMPLDNAIARKALVSGLKDLEDALQLYAALSVGCEYLITRNVKDFANNETLINITTPEAFLKAVLS